MAAVLHWWHLKAIWHFCFEKNHLIQEVHNSSLWVSFGTAEISLLMVVTNDHYVAICKPLSYEIIMSDKDVTSFSCGMSQNLCPCKHSDPFYSLSDTLWFQCYISFTCTKPFLEPLHVYIYPYSLYCYQHWVNLFNFFLMMVYYVIILFSLRA